MRTASGMFNATLQAGYFILSIRAHGLAAGPMSGFDAAGVDAEFFPDGRWHGILVVNIGHPGPPRGLIDFHAFGSKTPFAGHEKTSTP